MDTPEETPTPWRSETRGCWGLSDGFVTLPPLWDGDGVVRGP